MEDTITVKFKFEGRGGFRSESTIKTFPATYKEIDINEELENWVESLNSNSEVKFWGWEEVKH